MITPFECSLRSASNGDPEKTTEVRIQVRDGVELAATLYLPDPAAGPQPCLLEALPYRKDDLTSSYAPGYEQLRDEYGFAVCRLDLRGTGSSSGDATDEYPPEEQADLVEVIAWLAAQEWCNGKVGIFGTSYSGFNGLQLACERPPGLGAVFSIYSSDDRWTDDVHWRGAALKLVDLVDYCHYMTPMCVLPPVPALWPENGAATWREEWERRLATNEPWGLTWLRETSHGDYWQGGSVRIGGTTSGYERIEVPTMIVAGWADGYRNNSFRTMAELAANGVPHRLLAGPWAHADPKTAMPGPRIDLDVEMAAWFDRWLRSDDGTHESGCDVFVRTSTVPEPDLDLHEGYWVTLPSVPPTVGEEVLLGGRAPLPVVPDTGTAAWIDCAGHLPWGLSGDQRYDDARSLTWDVPPPAGPIVGHPRAQLRISVDQPLASLSVKLCDVFPDGTSALVSRGSVDLTFRDSVHGAPSPLVPGQEYDVTLELDACAYSWDEGQVLRVSIAGTDWPNTIAPPAPVVLTVHSGTVTLPVLYGSWPEPAFTPGAEHTTESGEGVRWSIEDDVIRRVTTAHTYAVSEYDSPYDGSTREEYLGAVTVDRRTWDQTSHAVTTYDLSWPGIDVRVTSTMDITITAAGFDVAIDTVATLDGEVVSHRTWDELVPRSVAG